MCRPHGPFCVILFVLLTSQLGHLLPWHLGLSGVCTAPCWALSSLLGGNVAVPVPMEAAVSAGGMSEVQEEDESEIDGIQIDCCDG